MYVHLHIYLFIIKYNFFFIELVPINKPHLRVVWSGTTYLKIIKLMILK